MNNIIDIKTKKELETMSYAEKVRYANTLAEEVKGIGSELEIKYFFTDLLTLNHQQNVDCSLFYYCTFYEAVEETCKFILNSNGDDYYTCRYSKILKFTKEGFEIESIEEYGDNTEWYMKGFASLMNYRGLGLMTDSLTDIYEYYIDDIIYKFTKAIELREKYFKYISEECRTIDKLIFATSNHFPILIDSREGEKYLRWVSNRNKIVDNFVNKLAMRSKSLKDMNFPIINHDGSIYHTTSFKEAVLSTCNFNLEGQGLLEFIEGDEFNQSDIKFKSPNTIAIDSSCTRNIDLLEAYNQLYSRYITLCTQRYGSSAITWEKIKNEYQLDIIRKVYLALKYKEKYFENIARSDESLKTKLISYIKSDDNNSVNTKENLESIVERVQRLPQEKYKELVTKLSSMNKSFQN